MPALTPVDAARLKAEILHELGNVDHVRAEIASRLDFTDDTTTYALALLLMNYYTGVERLFERVATALGGLPAGDRWHRQLLEDMTLDIEGVRPALITSTTAEALANLLRFRHIVRHLYAWSLRRAEIDVLARGLGATHAALSREVRQWCAFLDALRNE